MFFSLLLIASTAQAQEVIDSYELRAYLSGASQPIQTYDFDSSLVQCNLDPVTFSNTGNPSVIIWDDPNNTGKICRHDAISGSMLFSIPSGNYIGRLVAFNPFGESPESNDAPFAKGSPPSALSGLQLLRP